MPIELQGPLEETALDQMFDILMQGENACSLLVSDGVNEKIFYFSIGGIRMVSLGTRKSVPILEMLIQSGKIVPEERDRVLSYAMNHGKMSGEAAVEMGLVSREDVERVAEIQLEGELCDLFLWTDAEFEFREGQPPPQFYEGGHQACAVTCDVPEFLKGVRRRRERWTAIRRRISSERELFCTTAEGREAWNPEARDAESIVFGLVDGSRRLRDIREQAGLTAFQTFEALFELLEKGCVEKAESSDEARERGRAELLKEIERMEEARTEAVGDLIVRTRLAKAYEQVGDNMKAALVWKEIARLHRRKNDLKQTFTALRHAVRCVPEDFNTREQILEIYRAQGMMGKLLDEGRVVAEMLFKNNLLNRARNLLVSLIHLAPQDTRLRKLQAMTLFGLGEKNLALEEFKKLAALLEQEGGHKAELREVYRRILALDGRQKAIKKKLWLITSNRKAIWVARLSMAAAALLLLVGGGSFLYELLARSQFERREVKLKDLLNHQRYEEARAEAKRYRDQYPFSSVSRRMDDLLRQIERRELEYLRSRLDVDMRRARLAAEEGDVGSARNIYQRIAVLDPQKHPSVAEAMSRLEKIDSAEGEALKLVKEGSQLAKQGRLEAAHARFNSVISLYPQCVATRQVRYPLELVTVPSNAKVLHNGRLVAEGTPALVQYSPFERTEIRLMADGFEPFVLNVDKVLKPRETIYLRRETAWVYECDGPVEATPVLAGNTLYVAGRDRKLYAIDAETGETRFKTSLGIFGDSAGSVAVVGDVVVVGTARGELLGLDATYGEVTWRKTVGRTLGADLTPGPDRRTVYVTEGSGHVLAVRVRTGDVIWSSHAAAAPGSAPVVDQDNVYVGSADRQRLTVLDRKTGELLWSHTVRNAVAGNPRLYGSTVWFGSDDFHVYAVDLLSHEELTSFQTNGIVRAAPAVDGRNVYVGSSDGYLYCYNTGDRGRIRWRRPLGEGEVFGEALVRANRVYVGSTNGYLFALQRTNGEIAWAFRTGGPVLSRPVSKGRLLYVTSMDGKVYAIRDDF